MADVETPEIAEAIFEEKCIEKVDTGSTVSSEVFESSVSEDLPLKDQSRKRKRQNEVLTREQKIKKQIEYYFCDDNMQFDEFFQTKISDNDGWLDFQWLLSCTNLKALNCTSEDIKNAVRDNPLFLLKEDENMASAIQRKEPLPPLLSAEERQKRKDERKQSSKKRKPNQASDIHAAGCLVVVENLPEEVSQWGVVRDSLNKAFEKRGRTTRFVSQLRGDNTCLVMFHPFAGDKEEILSASVEIEGQKIKLSLLERTDKRYNQLINQMPTGIRQSRDKEMTNPNIHLLREKLKLADQEFMDITHLRSCVEQLLEETEVAAPLSETGEAVIKELVKYHPLHKNEVVEKVCVRTLPKKGNNEAKTFAIVRRKENENEEPSYESFSHWKCVNELSLAPPVSVVNKDVLVDNNKDDEK